MRLLLIALACLSVLCNVTQAQDPLPEADIILHNGIVYTVDADDSVAEAVAIRGSEILAAGGREEILRLAGPETRLVDLDGRFVVPGFNDNHVHFASAAQFLEFNIMRTDTQEEFVERVSDVVSRLEPGEWILGGFWGAYDEWAPGRAEAVQRDPFTPNMLLIEDIAADYPVFIRRFDNSRFAVNRTALKAAGLDPDNPEAENVVFERDEEGRLTGILRGDGVAPLFSPILPHTFTRERRLAQTRNALAEIRRHGVTNISDMSDDEQLELYRELLAEDELTVRVHFRPGLHRWEELAEQGIRIGSGDEWIRLSAVKGHIDGIMGNSTARFFEPYDHMPGERGRWRPLMLDENGNVVPEQFLDYMLNADRAGLQLTIHAIGDEANALLLDFLEEMIERNGERDRRFRLVHAQVMRPEDIARMGRLGVVAEVQPVHLSDDMRWMEQRIGTERSRGAYAFRSIQESGAILSFGTDWPGTSAAEYPINPMYGLYAAVTRKTLAGEPEGGWFPEERISMQDAIRAYTINTAYANFEDEWKGSIEPGKLADLAVLSHNLLTIDPEELLHVETHMTIVGGAVVYERGD